MKKLTDKSLTYLKSALKELIKKEYYHSESNSPYYRVFISIYEKKESIDFLLLKIKESPEPKNFKNDKLQKKFRPYK